MTEKAKPAPKHPAFGTRAGDSLFHDGEGGTLTRRQYDVAVKELNRIKAWQREQGKKQ